MHQTKGSPAGTHDGRLRREISRLRDRHNAGYVQHIRPRTTIYGGCSHCFVLLFSIPFGRALWLARFSPLPFGLRSPPPTAAQRIQGQSHIHPIRPPIASMGRGAGNCSSAASQPHDNAQSAPAAAAQSDSPAPAPASSAQPAPSSSSDDNMAAAASKAKIAIVYYSLYGHMSAQACMRSTAQQRRRFERDIFFSGLTLVCMHVCRCSATMAKSVAKGVEAAGAEVKVYQVRRTHAH